jgi:hypothetical protein
MIPSASAVAGELAKTKMSVSQAGSNCLSAPFWEPGQLCFFFFLELSVHLLCLSFFVPLSRAKHIVISVHISIN